MMLERPYPKFLQAFMVPIKTIKNYWNYWNKWKNNNSIFNLFYFKNANVKVAQIGTLGIKGEKNTIELTNYS